MKKVFINEAERILVVVRDITERKKLEQELQRLSFLDGLTGIANRRYFDEYLKKELKLSARSAAPLSMILCDIDYFKAYNDTYGHLAGDTCLINVANGLQSVLMRPTDIVARYGGEEFAVILPSTNEHGATVVAERLRTVVECLSIDHSGSLINQYVTISLGIATIYPKPDTPSTTLIEMADRALYQAKNAGRNQSKLIVFPR
ncbi:diguanylate cyclase (GGDEF) domain-containing protein [Desulfosporosinus acidiphilus SJ4]|uniref:Diguanylate cyclase (GGDEF) domain-containing protein n=1 Tax=Desulfosporosinus acidiphilus (strain DSM 22704 / JCM 16185 / SJ4) TaxID=646529 RepID=I4D2A7_DESAJ|nr:diguanylate cyclase (GGDEF) domain-containing protein [Desulfosporosinus acidiphilus SJ4]